MGAAYGTSVYQRTTEGGTDFSPMAAERAGKIFIGEALPGALGFSGGYKAPGEVYSAAVESNNAYKEALLKGQGERTIPDMSGMEQSDIIANSNYGTAAKPAKTFDIISGAATEIPSGTILKRNPVPEASRSLGLGWGIDEPSTTGRFDYYVKQPVVNAVTSPISYVKGDYAGFLQNAEAITPSVVLERPAFNDYVMSKVGAGRYADGEFTALPEYGPAPAAESPTIRPSYTPAEYGLATNEPAPSIARTAYGKQGNLITDVLEVGQSWKTETPSLGNEITTFKGGQPPEVSFREPIGDVSPSLSARAYGKQSSLVDYATSFRNWFEARPTVSDSELYSPRVTEEQSLGLSRAYGNTPADRPVEYLKLLWQESSYPQKISDFGVALRYPAREIETYNADVMRGFRGTEETAPQWKGWKSSLNIFGGEHANVVSQPSTGSIENAGLRQANAASGGLESQSGSGAVSLSGIASGSFDRLQGIESGINGMPLYPSGPSPIQKQRYTIEDETQYYTLPPGMKSPGQKQETTQNIIRAPATITGISLESATEKAQRTRQESVAKQSFFDRVIPAQKNEQRQVTAIGSDFAVTPLAAVASVFTQVPSSEVTQKSWQDSIITPRTDVIVTPTNKQITTQQQKQTIDQQQKQVPWQDITTNKIVTPIIPGIPWGGGGGGSGGSPIGRGRLKRELFSYAPKNLQILSGPKSPRQPAVKKAVKRR